MKISFKDFKDTLPFLTTAIILLSILKEMTFYYRFGIRINEYIEFTETFTLFLTDTIWILVLTIFIVGVTFYLGALGRKILYGLIIMVALVFLICTYYNYYKSVGYSWLYFMAVFGGIVLIPVLNNKLINQDHSDNNKSQEKKYFVSAVLLSVCLALIISLWFEFNATLKPPETMARKIVCTLKKDNDNEFVIKTNKDTVFLGKTRTNIFFYVIPEGKTLIYQSDDVKAMEMNFIDRAK